MFAKIKNILIFVVVAAILVLIYIYFIKGTPDQGSLVSTSSTVPDDTTTTSVAGSTAVGQEFLTLLLNVKTIKLDDAIFSDPAFMSLRDSSITLVQDGNEGRPNPFAPIGSDAGTSSATPVAPLPGVTSSPVAGVGAN